MLNNMVQESPLNGMSDQLLKTLKKTSPAFSFQERPFTTLINLRGDATSAAFTQAVNKVLKLQLPLAANQSTAGANLSLTWLGPDEWLIQSTDVSGSALEAALQQELLGQFYSVVDVSSGFTVFELGGACVRDVLAKGCPLDLHPSVITEGQSAQSHYFKSAILLRCKGADQFELVVRRSFAEYCCQMLLDAADEFFD